MILKWFGFKNWGLNLMTRFLTWTTLATTIYSFTLCPAYTQSPLDWTTAGFDAQRSHWVRGDTKISTKSIQTGQFQQIWNHTFNNIPQHPHSLRSPILFDFYIGYRGFRSLGFVGSNENRIFAIDTDLARKEWTKTLGHASVTPEVYSPCPGGMTANITRHTPVGIPFLIPQGSGRRSPAVSGVGKSKKGAVTLKDSIRRPSTEKPSSIKSSRARETADKWGEEFLGLQYIYALGRDGFLYAYYVSDGDTNKKPIKFLAPNANAKGLIVTDNFAYVSTTGSCGGVENGVWAVNLHNKKTIHWKTTGGISGFTGPAFSPGGVVYVATTGKKSSSVFSLDAKTLEQTGRYTPDTSLEFTSTPLVIDYKERDLLAVAGTDGRIHLLKGEGLDKDGLVQRSAVYSNNKGTTALSTWRDLNGVTWIVAPSSGSAASNINFPVANGSVTRGSITSWKYTNQTRLDFQ